MASTPDYNPLARRTAKPSLTPPSPPPPNQPPSRPRRSLLMRLVLAVGWLVLLGGIAGSVGGYLYIVQRFEAVAADLPDISIVETFEPSQVTRVLAADGTELHSFYLQQRQFIPFEEIPQHVVHAILAIEDTRFYLHSGVDFYRILGAMVKNLKAMSVVEGGSTITQQLVKNMFLEDEVYVKDEDSGQVRAVRGLSGLDRKIKEAILAQRIDSLVGKDRVLELYLNLIYFGSRAYGIESAALNYFGKSARDLTLAEAAMLCGLPKGPNAFTPRRHPERAKNRRNTVLRRMYDVGYISREEYDQACLEPIVVTEAPAVNEQATAPYLVETVRGELERRLSTKAVHEGGLTIHTGIDVGMQRVAERAVRDGVRQISRRRGWRGVLGKDAERKPDPTNTASYTDKTFGIKHLLPAKIERVKANALAVSALGVKGELPMEHLRWAVTEKLEAAFATGDEILVTVEEVTLDGTTTSEPYTALDLEQVLAAQKSGKCKVVYKLDQEPDVEGAIILMEPKTGAVRAMVGGYDFEKSRFNRAVQAKRQPGSSVKTLLYTAALASGYTPATMIEEIPVIKGYTGESISRSEEDDTQQRLWRPGNYDGAFHGSVSLRYALQHSLNIPAVQVLEDIGPNRFIALARLMGIVSPIPPNLSIALGSPDMTLVELTGAYGVFPNGGVLTKPRLYTTVQDKDGTIIVQQDPFSHRVLDEQTAYLMTSMLQSVVRGGTAARAQRIGQNIAGKTGTTNGNKDAWFLGFSPSYVCGVWVGLDQPGKLGRKETGSSAALPIWMEMMAYALESETERSFKQPEDITTMLICADNGLLPTADCSSTYKEFFRNGTAPTTYPAVAGKRQQKDIFATMLLGSGGDAVASPTPSGALPGDGEDDPFSSD